MRSRCAAVQRLLSIAHEPYKANLCSVCYRLTCTFCFQSTIAFGHQADPRTTATQEQYTRQGSPPLSPLGVSAAKNMCKEKSASLHASAHAFKCEAVVKDKSRNGAAARVV